MRRLPNGPRGCIGTGSVALLIGLVLAFPAFASGQPSEEGAASSGIVPSPSPTEEETPSVSPEEPAREVVPVFPGDVVPWPGLLVPETTFVEYLRLDLRTQELEGIIQIKTELLDTLQLTYEGAMREVVGKEESWWTQYGFTVGIVGGLVLGVGLTILGAWALGQL